MRFGFNYGVGKGSARYRNSFLISYLMDTVYTDGAMNRFLDNVGSNGSNNDAKANASNHIYLNGTTQSVPYPVLHTLGADMLNTTAPSVVNADETTVFTSDTSNNFDLEVTVVGTGGTNPRVNTNNTSTPVTESTYVFDFDVVVTSGVAVLENIFIGGSIIAIGDTLTTGTYRYEASELAGASTVVQFQFNGTNLFDISVTNWTFKETTLPTASYMTILQADGTIKQLSSTGDVGEELVVDGDFNTNLDNFVLNVNTDATLSGGVMTFGSNGSGWPSISQDVPVVVDRNYLAVWDYVADNSTATDQFKLDSISVNNPSIGDVEINFVATTAVAKMENVIQSSDVANTIDIGSYSLKEVLPISTTYSVTDSHQFVFNHTSPLSAEDVSAIEADANLAFRMFFDGEILPSGFSRANDMVDCNFFGGNEGLASGAYVQDLSVDLGSEKVVNDGFDTDTDWSKGGTTTISGGTLNANTSNTDAIVTQDNNVLFEGSVYLVEFDVLSVTRGEVNFALKGTNYLNTTDLQIGKHSYIVLAGSGAFDTYLRGLATGAEFVMDNYSIKEIIGYAEIYLYDSATRITLANQSNGATNIKLIQDGSGRTTGTVTDNTTQWEQGANAPTGWTVTAPYTITEIIGADTYTFTSDLNRYKNGIADGTFTAPVGVWTLDEFGFDGVTPVTIRGKASMIDEVVIP